MFQTPINDSSSLYERLSSLNIKRVRGDSVPYIVQIIHYHTSHKKLKLNEHYIPKYAMKQYDQLVRSRIVRTDLLCLLDRVFLITACPIPDVRTCLPKIQRGKKYFTRGMTTYSARKIFFY